MGDTSDEILRAYIENVLRLQQERDRASLSDEELRQIALDTGMTEADLDYVRRRYDDCLNRGQGYIRYKNWSDAIEELDQARALAPYSVEALNAVATAYTGRWREKGSEADREHARKAAERALEIDSSNDTALRIVSGLRTEREELLGQETRTQRSGGGKKYGLVMLGIMALVIVLLLFKSASQEPAASATTPQTAAQATPEKPAIPEPEPEKPAEPEKTPEPPSIASEVLTFGREGIGAGQFTDARSIAVDGAGRVYVAEYGSGRIQAFDSAGNYLQQWSVGEHHYVTGMTADQQGHVYIVHTGRIFRYDGATGKLLGEVKYPGGPGFRTVAAMADGGLAAAWDGHWQGGLLINPKSKDNLVIFDRDLRATRTVKNIISSVSGGVVFSPIVAVDGLGNIFMLAQSGDAVYRYTPQGKFVDKFGGGGAGERGKIGGTRGIAVDGRGRVFVTGFSGIHAFDGEGNYLGTTQMRGALDDIAFNAKDELYVVARTKVVKMVVNGKSQ